MSDLYEIEKSGSFNNEDLERISNYFNKITYQIKQRKI